VRHVEVGATAADSGALAEGVWEYVSRLVKSYRTKEMEIQYQVSGKNTFPIGIKREIVRIRFRGVRKQPLKSRRKRNQVELGPPPSSPGLPGRSCSR
jgi:hypothetical protein